MWIVVVAGAWLTTEVQRLFFHIRGTEVFFHYRGTEYTERDTEDDVTILANGLYFILKGLDAATYAHKREY